MVQGSVIALPDIQPAAPIVVSSDHAPGIIDQQPRCWRCGRMVAWFVARPWRVSCGRCRAVNGSEPVENITKPKS